MECLSTVGFYKIKISYFLFQKGRTGPQPQSDQSKTKLQQCKNSMSNIWDPLRIFRPPPKGLGHFSSSTLSSTHSWTARLRPVPLHPLLPLLVVLPWYWHLPMLGHLLQPGCTFTSSLYWLSRCQASTFSITPQPQGLHCHPSCTFTNGLSSPGARPQLLSMTLFMSSKPAITWVTLTHVRV